MQRTEEQSRGDIYPPEFEILGGGALPMPCCILSQASSVSGDFCAGGDASCRPLLVAADSEIGPHLHSFMHSDSQTLLWKDFVFLDFFLEMLGFSAARLAWKTSISPLPE